MSEMSYGQLREEKLRELYKYKYPSTSSFSYSKQWMIEQIESLLVEYPVLRTINYQEYGANGLLALIKTLIDDVEVISYHSDTVLVIEAKPSKPFLTMKEFMLIFFLSSFTKFSLFHIIFAKKKMQSIDCKDEEAFFYLYENSVVLTNEEKQKYHFITSIESIVDYIYLSPDQLIKKLSRNSELPNSYGNASISEYIDNNKIVNNLDDNQLNEYLKKEPIYIDIKKLILKKRKLGF